MKSLFRKAIQKRYLVAMGFVVLAVVFGASAFSSRGMASPSNRVIKSEDLGDWAYRATLEEDGWTSVWVDWKEGSLAD